MIKNSLQKNRSLFVVLLFMIIAVLGAVDIWFQWITVESERSNNILHIAKTAKLALPSVSIKALNAEPTDIEKPEYIVVKNLLKEMVRVNTDAKFAYIYLERDGKLFFIADSEPDTSKDCSPPGQEYTEADSNYTQPFHNGNAVITPPVTDRWGTWISALIPINDEATGKTIAIFGMDYSTSSWNTYMLFQIVDSIFLVVVLLILSFLLIKIVSKNKFLKSEAVSRKHAEDLLKESLLMFRTMFQNHASVMLLIEPVSGQIVDANTSAANYYGYSLNELKAMQIDQINILDNKEVLKKRDLAIKDEKNYFVFPHKLKNGEIRTVEVHSSPIEQYGQKLLFSIINDITDKKQAEEMLKLSNLKNIAMISNISDIIGIIGVDGLMKYKSPNIEKWFGWQPQDLVGADGFSNVHLDDLERVQKIFHTILGKDNSSTTMEFMYKCKDGSFKPIELTATNLVNDPIIGGVLLNYHDITQRKEAEANLQNSVNETERMNRLMINREMRVVEMKKELNALLKELGREAKYESVK